MAQVVLRLEQERRLEVGGQRRDVEQRAEPLVEQPPASRAGGCRSADRPTARSEPSAVSTSRSRGSTSTDLSPAGRSTANWCAAVASSQRRTCAVPARSTTATSTGSRISSPSRRTSISTWLAAAGARRDPHRFEAVVHPRQRAQPLPPEPAEIGAERLGGGAAERLPLVQGLARERGESWAAEQIEQLVVDEPRAGRGRIGEEADVIANAVLVLDVAEVARRRGEQRRVDELVDRGDEVERAQQIGRVFELLELQDERRARSGSRRARPPPGCDRRAPPSRRCARRRRR